jgi:hypothetical protein
MTSLDLYEHAIEQLHRVIDQNPKAARHIIACMKTVRLLDYEIAERKVVSNSINRRFPKTLAKLCAAIDANPAIAVAILETLQLLENATIQTIQMYAGGQVKGQGMEESLRCVHENAGRPKGTATKGEDK